MKQELFAAAERNSRRWNYARFHGISPDFYKIFRWNSLSFICFYVELGFNLAFAAKMHGCQGKNTAKAQEILSFSVSFQWFMIKNLLL